MMETRRKFIKTLVGCFTFMGLLLNPLFVGIRSGMTKAKKIILPKGTKRESLIGKNTLILMQETWRSHRLKISEPWGFQAMR